MYQWQMLRTYCPVYHETGRIQKREAERLCGSSCDDTIFINGNVQNRVQEVIIMLGSFGHQHPRGTIIVGVG